MLIYARPREDVGLTVAGFRDALVSARSAGSGFQTARHIHDQAAKLDESAHLACRGFLRIAGIDLAQDAID